MVSRISNGENGEHTKNSQVDIIDIRRSFVEINMREELLRCLQKDEGKREISSMILYNETGLKLFEKITYLDEYYLTNAEIEIFQNSAQEIAHFISSGSIILELGSGNLRKIAILLEKLEAEGKSIDYYALDLSQKELNRTLGEIPPFQHVRCHGLHGTFDDGLHWLRKNGNSSRPTCVMFLGSSLGNFDHTGASVFLRGFSDILKPTDSILIGIDGTCDPMKIYHAYNDREGITHKFILNGLQHMNEIFGKQLFSLNDWKVVGEYVYDDNGGRHQAFYSPVHDVYCADFLIKANERIQVEKSLKFSPEEATNLWTKSRLTELNRWTASTASYSLYLLKRESISFDLNPKLYATPGLPTLKEWRDMWRVWDKITLEMVPTKLLGEKPIILRHNLIFYLGHSPNFLDLQISKVVDGLSLDKYSYYNEIFERGIDPDVDDPQKCHPHSKVPEIWPPLEEILEYQRAVHAKLETVYESEKINHDIASAIWVSFEHQLMHLETFLYMILHLDVIMPPTKYTPDFEAEAKKAKAMRVPNKWFQIPSQKITIGIEDLGDAQTNKGSFGWDNEKPSRVVEVPAFQAQARPLSIEDYLNYLEQTQKSEIPASWVFSKGLNRSENGCSNGLTNEENFNGFVTKKNIEKISVRTVYGLIPIKLTLDWPVFASFDELARCARWMKARIPTFEEARSIYAYVDAQRPTVNREKLDEASAINGNGIYETSSLPQQSTQIQNIFSNLDNANVGFKNWHPVAVTGNGNTLAGQAEMGGVWEWTSSPLRKHEGFEPMKLYPGYTADFFDEKHNIILGGSWATHPRIASRRSFINWYQPNYPYVWAGVRLVRDL